MIDTHSVQDRDAVRAATVFSIAFVFVKPSFVCVRIAYECRVAVRDAAAPCSNEKVADELVVRAYVVDFETRCVSVCVNICE